MTTVQPVIRWWWGGATRHQMFLSILRCIKCILYTRVHTANASLRSSLQGNCVVHPMGPSVGGVCVAGMLPHNPQDLRTPGEPRAGACFFPSSPGMQPPCCQRGPGPGDTPDCARPRGLPRQSHPAAQGSRRSPRTLTQVMIPRHTRAPRSSSEL